MSSAGEGDSTVWLVTEMPMLWTALPDPTPARLFDVRPEISVGDGVGCDFSHGHVVARS